MYKGQIKPIFITKMKTTTTTIKLTVVTNSNYSMEIVINKPQQ